MELDEATQATIQRVLEFIGLAGLFGLYLEKILTALIILVVLCEFGICFNWMMSRSFTYIHMNFNGVAYIDDYTGWKTGK